MLKTILVLLISIVIFITLIKPARLIVNKNIFFPVISSILPNYEVNIATNGTAVIVINHRVDKNGALLHKHLNTIARKHYLALPFGGMYIIPFVLLVFQKNWELAKKFTFYNIALFLTSVSFIIPAIKWSWVFNFEGFFSLITIVLSLIFTLIALRN